MKPTFTPTPSEAAAIAEALDAMANTNGNGATMTAAELIDLLKSHPKACGALGITLDIGNRWTSASDGNGVWFSDIDTTCWEGKPDYQTPRFRRWLIGAAQEWADENGIHTEFRSGIRDEYVASWGRQEEYQHLGSGPTRLHALLAAIEAVA